jgi:hypothetical protein
LFVRLGISRQLDCSSRTLNWRELQLNDRRPARASRDDMRYTKGYLKP